MGYSEICCQLCGVSFAIARIRTPYEPIESAWSSTGDGYVDQEGRGDIEETCGRNSGCQTLERPGLYGGDEIGIEHLAGPGCVCAQGYSGCQISVEEMKGCRTVQCLMKKSDGWETEDDDQDFELKSNYFLTGFGDGSPDESPLENITLVRHEVDDLLITNIQIDDDDWGLPFHPTCFEIFKKISKARLNKVDVQGLWEWRDTEFTYENFFEEFPREFAVRNGHEQWWQHERGSEYLAANPVEIPGLEPLLKSCHRQIQSVGGQGKELTYDVNGGVYNWRYKGPEELYDMHHMTPPPVPGASTDFFMKLPTEIFYKILNDLGSKDVANLRLVTNACRQLPIIMFRERILTDMPWLWEVQDLPAHQTDWYKMYTMVKGCWQNIKGLKNRKRIWKDVNEIVTRIEKLRAKGNIY